MDKSISCVAAALCCLAMSVAGAQADSSSQAANAAPAAKQVQVLSGRPDGKRGCRPAGFVAERTDFRLPN